MFAHPIVEPGLVGAGGVDGEDDQSLGHCQLPAARLIRPIYVNTCVHPHLRVDDALEFELALPVLGGASGAGLLVYIE
jgi:hypothetical protein